MLWLSVFLCFVFQYFCILFFSIFCLPRLLCVSDRIRSVSYLCIWIVIYIPLYSYPSFIAIFFDAVFAASQHALIFLLWHSRRNAAAHERARPFFLCFLFVAT